MTPLQKAQHEFERLVEDLRTAKYLNDDQQAEVLRAALGALPETVTAPVLKRLRERSEMAEKIKAQYGLGKARHATRDELGRFAVAAGGPGMPPTPTASSGDSAQPATGTLDWVHLGNPHPGLPPRPGPA